MDSQLSFKVHINGIIARAKQYSALVLGIFINEILNI